MPLPVRIGLVVVTTPEVSAIRDADRIIGLLEACWPPAISTWSDQPDPATDVVQGAGSTTTVDDVVDILAVPLIGVGAGRRGRRHRQPIRANRSAATDIAGGTAPTCNVCQQDSRGRKCPVIELDRHTGLSRSGRSSSEHVSQEQITEGRRMKQCLVFMRQDNPLARVAKGPTDHPCCCPTALNCYARDAGD